MSNYKKYIISLIINIFLMFVIIVIFSYASNQKKAYSDLKTNQTDHTKIQSTVEEFVKYAFARDGKNYKRNVEKLKPIISSEIYEQFLEEDYGKDESAEIVSSPVYESIEQEKKNLITYIAPVSVHYKYGDNDFGVITTVWKITCSLDDSGNATIIKVDAIEPGQKTEDNTNETK